MSLRVQQTDSRRAIAPVLDECRSIGKPGLSPNAWCGPCMAAIPKNVAFVEKYKDKGVALIGIHDAKGGWDTVDQVISEKGINYPIALDATKEDRSDGQGRVRYTSRGNGDSPKDLDRRLTLVHRRL